jgi:hypothetical protein
MIKAGRTFRGVSICGLRERAAAGVNRTKLAKEFGISRETLYQYIR